MQALMIRIGNFLFRHRNRVFPILICALFLLAAPPAQYFGSEALEDFKDIVALAIALSGLAVRATTIGFAYIKRGGVDKKVYADRLVTGGLFGLCRNPLYLGNILIYTGVFLMHGSPLVIGLGMASFLFIYWCLVCAEEAYLAGRFGEDYRAYCAEVPRWLPKLSRFRESTAGMEFNVRRVILKDYTTIAATLIALALTEVYEYVVLPDLSTHRTYIAFAGLVIVLAGLMTVLVRISKKRRWLTESAA
jgi:protein-S-isoprenylcysteine O-methyltransferase Ste14